MFSDPNWHGSDCLANRAKIIAIVASGSWYS